MSSSDPLNGDHQRWRLDLAYDGAAFSGFAYQPEATTVVGVLRETLASTLHLDREPVIVGAGRTDAGVHAFGQVVHVDLPTTLFASRRRPDPERLARSLNKQLRGRIQVLAARPVSDDFHARFSASWREYRYLVLETAPPALGLSTTWSWAVEGPLDVALMNEVSRDILGTHDFRAFCRRPANAEPGEALLRDVQFAQWERIADVWTMSPGSAPVVRLTIRAQSFCHNMVRCLVSTIVAIGQGQLAPDTLKERLESRKRDHLPSAAPAAGLCLVAVGYPAFAHGTPDFVG
ncbi:MAG: tRNA pseudouridine(38-40) synthase TruA [Acidimicrobiales bacterium]